MWLFVKGNLRNTSQPVPAPYMLKCVSSPALLTLKTNFTTTPFIFPGAWCVGDKQQLGSHVLPYPPAHPTYHQFLVSPQEIHRHPYSVHCDLLACDILAAAPAGCESLFLFVFLLNHSALFVFWQNHTLGASHSIFRKPHASFTPSHALPTCKPRAKRLTWLAGGTAACLRWQERRQEGRQKRRNPNNGSPREELFA